MDDPFKFRLGVLILTGGLSSRMGADKAELLWGGRRAADRLADLAASLQPAIILTIGRRDYGLPFLADAVEGGGPVTGIITGLAALANARCDRALVLAVDAPTIERADLLPLLAAPNPGAAYERLQLPLVMDPAAAPAEAAPGWSVNRLIQAAALTRLACPPDSMARLRGANTPSERETLSSLVTDRPKSN